jgi:hypothetical protein
MPHNDDSVTCYHGYVYIGLVVLFFQLFILLIVPALLEKPLNMLSPYTWIFIFKDVGIFTFAVLLFLTGQMIKFGIDILWLIPDKITFTQQEICFYNLLRYCKRVSWNEVSEFNIVKTKQYISSFSISTKEWDKKNFEFSKDDESNVIEYLLRNGKKINILS